MVLRSAPHLQGGTSRREMTLEEEVTRAKVTFVEMETSGGKGDKMGTGRAATVIGEEAVSGGHETDGAAAMADVDSAAAAPCGERLAFSPTLANFLRRGAPQLRSAARTAATGSMHPRIVFAVSAY